MHQTTYSLVRYPKEMSPPLQIQDQVWKNLCQLFFFLPLIIILSWPKEFQVPETVSLVNLLNFYETPLLLKIFFFTMSTNIMKE